MGKLTRITKFNINTTHNQLILELLRVSQVMKLEIQSIEYGKFFS